MAKRSRLEIIRDILKVVRENGGKIKITPLIRKSNISSSRFKEYYFDLIKKDFIREIENHKNGKFIFLTDKGSRFLLKYQTIIEFIDEFDL